MSKVNPLYVVLVICVVLFFITSLNSNYKTQAQAGNQLPNAISLGSGYSVWQIKSPGTFPKTCIVLAPNTNKGADFDCFIDVLNIRSLVPTKIGDTGIYELWNVKIDIPMQPDKNCLVQIPNDQSLNGTTAKIRCLS
jgi:hypothetical protein